MERQHNTKAIVESGILTAVAVVLILMCLYLPAFILVGLFIWPIPITLIYIRHDLKYSLISLAVTLILTSITSDPITAFGLVSIYGILSVVLGYCIKSKRTSVFSITAMSVAVFLSTLMVIKLLSAFYGQDLIGNSIHLLDSSYKNMKSMYQSMGVSKASIDKTMAYLPKPEQMRMIMPSAFIAYSIFVAFVCYMVTRMILRRFKYEVPALPALSEWYIPSRVSFAIIIILVISFIMMNTGAANGNASFVNANILFTLVFTVNAVALISWWLKKANVTKVLRWVIVVILVLSPLSMILSFLGIFDYIVDYRKLDSSRRKPKKQ